MQYTPHGVDSVNRKSNPCGMFLLVIVLSGCTPRVWEASKPAENVSPTPQAIGSLTVKFDLDPLAENKPNVKIKLPGFDDDVIAVREEFENIGEGRFVWRGKIKGDAGSVVTFSAVNGRLVGNISTSQGRLFGIRYVKRGVALIEELDATKFPKEEAQGRPEVNLGRGMRLGTEVNLTMIRDSARFLLHTPGSDQQPELIEAQFEETQDIAPVQAHTYVDLLVLYTAAAGNFENDPQAMESTVQQLISDTNKAYRNSKINQEVRLARLNDTAYTESGAIDLDWLALLQRGGTPPTEGADPPFKEVDGLINTHQADIVVLLTKPAEAGESCGTGSQMHRNRKSFCSFAVAVVPVTCATTKYSFAHELGHVMGADHNDEGGTSNPPFPSFSRGYIAPSNKWHTVMAYPANNCALPDCQRIQFFSSSDPSVVFEEGGVTERTGDATSDNAKALGETAVNVAQFSDECIAIQAAESGGP